MARPTIRLENDKVRVVDFRLVPGRDLGSNGAVGNHGAGVVRT